MSKHQIDYSQLESSDSNNTYVDNTSYNPIYRMPTINNPMMNVPITSYNTPQTYKDYNRYAEAPKNSNNQIQHNIQNDLTMGLYMDPADVFFQHNNSQRQFYPMPNGSVPNDQTSFAENLYGREYVCKAGSIWSRYPVAYTDDSLACTGFEGDGQLTNFGKLSR